MHANETAVLSPAGLAALLAALRGDGFDLVGPSLRDGAIVYAEIAGIEDLPRGWTEVQEAGTYRVQRRSDDALFGYTVGPHSWKQFLFVPRLRLWQAQRQGTSFRVDADAPAPPRLAFIGARACDLQAIAVQDRTFLGGTFVDPDYAARRAGVFVLAVNCGAAAATCFCVSMESGPRATAGFDLVVTELLDPPHRFVVEVGSERGADVLRRVDGTTATANDTEAVTRLVDATAASMQRHLDTTDLPALLYGNLDSSRWDEVASRCLSCANCTMVCPTCFCSTVEDVTDLSGEDAERWRRWDSCFTVDHSYLHGGSARPSTKSQYRQWLTHKLAGWVHQFGTSGCTGCGRCIAWCPVGIDLTAEVAAIRTQAAAGAQRE